MVSGLVPMPAMIPQRPERSFKAAGRPHLPDTYWRSLAGFIAGLASLVTPKQPAITAE